MTITCKLCNETLLAEGMRKTLIANIAATAVNQMPNLGISMSQMWYFSMKHKANIIINMWRVAEAH